MTDVVEIIVGPTHVTVVEIVQTDFVEIIGRGQQGPPGLSGNANIGGKPVNITNPSLGDVLSYGDDAWINAPQTALADGGNF
jgi:hypothetical protein